MPSRPKLPKRGDPFVFHDVAIPPGTTQRVDLPIADLPTTTPMPLPVEVVVGARPGPTLWLSAALHGDELNGMEIIRRVLARLDPAALAGTVLAVPIVNVFGFISQQRYLPDRRDLNRSFPGSRNGSLAARIAHLLLQQVIKPADFGVDLHTASNHRTNLPQTRGNLDDPRTHKLATAFAAPVTIHGHGPAGSLRHAVAKLNKPVIVYEAGEPHRFNDDAVDQGVAGVLRVLHAFEMRRSGPGQPRRAPLEARSSTWLRARRAGILHLDAKLGRSVQQGDRLGTIRDAFGDHRAPLTAPHAGVVIGHTLNPMVNQGDGVLHLAERPVSVASLSTDA
jgi:predicted deacylase